MEDALDDRDSVREFASREPDLWHASEDREPSPSFASFYEDSFASMVGLAYLLTGSKPLAEDLVHDAFARVYVRWRRVREPNAYLRRAVINACRSSQRQAARERRLQFIEPVAGDALDADELFDALAVLTYRQRAAIVLRYYEGRSFADVAMSLGCREATARSLVHRGTEQLRRVIEQ
jgi:RNA polymerase sigma factor (sigma-70 family)